MQTPDPQPQQLPSTSRLLVATIIAMIVAFALLLIAVLPAEYGVDPTGLGAKTGLLGLSTESAGTTGNTASATTGAAPVWKRDGVYRTDTLEVELEPGQGTEVKASMQAGERYFYSWKVTGGEVVVDMHGEEPGETKEFTSYWEEAGQTEDQGYFEAPFTGTHGWWWVNKGNQPVTVTVTTAGYYEKLFEM